MVVRPHRDQLEAGQLTHLQLRQRGAVQDGTLQPAGGEHAQPGWLGAGIPHQHAASALGLEHLDHRDDVGGAVHRGGGPHHGLGHPRQAQGLLLMLVVALRQRAEFFGQIGKQQRTKGGVLQDQVTHGLLGQLVGQHLLGRHKPAAGAAGHQGAAVKTIVGAVAAHHLDTIQLAHVALDQDKQVGRLHTRLQHRGAAAEIGDVHVVAHQLALRAAQAVKRRGGKVEGLGHGGRCGTQRGAAPPSWALGLTAG